MSEIRTIFSGFEQSFLSSAVRLLAGLAGQGRVPDLSGCLCIVPTAEAGRRLRAALALHFSPFGGVIPPGTVQPLGLLEAGNTASDGEILAAWLRTLKSPVIRQAPSLLRNCDRKTEGDAILLHIAEKLQQTRLTLAGAGLSLTVAAGTLDTLCRTEAGTLENYCRFAEFRLLEEDYLCNLAKPDPAQALLENAAAFPGGETRHIVVIGCPDAPEIFYPALVKAAAAGSEVTVLVDGADDGSFDALGRPLTEKWLHRAVGFPVERLRRFSSVQEEARYAAKTLEAGFHPAVIGVLGEELPGAFRDELRSGGTQVRFPEESPLGSSGFGSFFLDLLELMEQGASYAALAKTVRHELFLSYAARQGVSAESLLNLLDRIKSDHLTVTAAQFTERAGQGAEPVGTLLKRLAEARHSESVLRALYDIFAEIGETAEPDLPDREAAAAELEALGQAVAEAEKAGGDDPELNLLLIRYLLKKRTLHLEEDAAGAAAMAGFLELAFCEEPDLLICGLNEENFNRAGSSDIFLPENARDALGMRSSEDRYAADIARFDALCRHRAAGGSLTFSCAKASSSGDALMPARLFFQCSGEELPGRVELLFRGGLDRRIPAVTAKETFFPYYIRSEEPKKRFSVTSFSSYLRCPFRFYLEHVLNAEECDDRSCEFDAAHYGTIAHEILEKTVARSAGMTEAAEIEAVALAELENAKKRRFGLRSPGPSLLQFELLANDLHYFAQVEERLRADGWQTIAREKPLQQDWRTVHAAFFPCEAEEDWRSTIELKGQIDRIDLNSRTGAVRVIDYKTYRDPVTPGSTHLKSGNRMEELPFSQAWDKLVWIDLQLPLYLALLRLSSPEFAGAPVEGAYFNLPLAAGNTKIEPFRELNSEERLLSAVRCADLCLRRIFVEHIFWPPGKAASPNDLYTDFFGSAEREKLILPADWREES